MFRLRYKLNIRYLKTNAIFGLEICLLTSLESGADF
jgi:hypothetical protein